VVQPPHTISLLAMGQQWSRGPGDDEVTVRVRLGESTATARASNAP